MAVDPGRDKGDLVQARADSLASLGLVLDRADLALVRVPLAVRPLAQGRLVVDPVQDRADLAPARGPLAVLGGLAVSALALGRVVAVDLVQDKVNLAPVRALSEGPAGSAGRALRQDREQVQAALALKGLQVRLGAISGGSIRDRALVESMTMQPGVGRRMRQIVLVSRAIIRYGGPSSSAC